MMSDSGGKLTKSSVGISFNGGEGEFDTYWLVDESLNIRQSAIQVYWVLGLQPTLGFMTGGTRVTVTGVNLQAVGTGGDNTNMRCRFGNSIIFPDPLQIPDPVDFTGGTIQCTSPATIESTATKEVVFGICLIGADCEYTGKEKQAASTNSYMPSVNHFTRSSPYLYYTAPQISTLTPSLGPREGSTYVTIRGVGFFASPFLSCRFDLGHYSTASSFIDSSTVVCKTPAITAAQYSVEITQNGQQYSGGCSGVDDSTGKTGVCWYYFYIEPIITSVAPQAGINTGLSRVVITLSNPVLNYHELHCRFQTAFTPDQKRLSIEGSTMITKASASGSTAWCFSPTSVSANSQPMLHTPTSEMPLRGLTYVSLTWNGQQYGPHDTSANTEILVSRSSRDCGAGAIWKPDRQSAARHFVW